MQTFTASEAKNKLGLVFDSAQKHPVSIEKQGRPFLVILSKEAYEILEDSFWLLKAKEAEEEGYIGTEESEAFLNKMRNRDNTNNKKEKK